MSRSFCARSDQHGCRKNEGNGCFHWCHSAGAIRSAGRGPDLRLVEAVRDRDAQAVAALLKQNVDVDGSQPDGATALHWLLTGTTSLEELLTFFREGQAEAGFEAGIDLALRRVLTSPSFLFRTERDPAAGTDAPYAISDLELASRFAAWGDRQVTLHLWGLIRSRSSTAWSRYSNSKCGIRLSQRR